MNAIAEEMRAVLEGKEDVELYHYGMPRRSGRYPWGSGEDPYQRNMDFMGRVNQMKKAGMNETEIARELGIFNYKGQPSISRLRNQYSVAKDENKLYKIATAKSLAEDGLGPTEIGRKMGLPEGTVRSLLNPKVEENASKAKNTADFIEARIKEKGMIDVGGNISLELGVSPKKLEEALIILENRGYPTYGGRMDQPNNPGQKTTLKVVCPPGTKSNAIYDVANVHSLQEYQSRDGGETFAKFVYPKSMDSKRLMVRYKEDGGEDKDGIVELRRGVDDLSLGNSRYSQVRILVDDKKYIKGMAVYGDDKDFPPGVDVIFNTNKGKSVAKLDVLKDIKDDPDNPFGSLIKPNGQSTYIDKKGKEQLSLINKRADEGDWTDWKDALPSQFLGKQSRAMAKKQLDLAKADKMAEFDEICSLNNPTIKKHLLREFSDSCDGAAVHLKAAALPGQKYHVIIPVNTLKDNEVYAPQYEPGTKLALIRYPHGGTFEIPILTVNNKNADARKIIGTDSIDAIGITKKNADRLSGADFDGDTVMCIPTHDKAGKVKITSTPPLKDLEGFDPKASYPERKGMRYMKDPVTKVDNTQREMGEISNLITDMTLAGASTDKLARAVKHSMVVIDAAKHKLDYRRSFVENNIQALKDEYQPKYDEDGNLRVGKGGGAATILSRSKGDANVLRRQGSAHVNVEGDPLYDPNKPLGSKVYKIADDLEYTVTKVNKRTGEVTTTVEQRKQRVTKMEATDDANTLVSTARHPMELLYADYANSMKALGNRARLEMVGTKGIKYDPKAKEIYRAEYDSLKQKIKDAELNAPREREATRRAIAEVQGKIASASEKPSKADIRKWNQQAVTKYRGEVGAIARRERNINITDREWEAIQAGAISDSMLQRILKNTDVDKLRQRAMPRTTTTLSTAKINKIKAMSNSNHSLADIAKAVGVSPATVSRYLKGSD